MRLMTPSKKCKHFNNFIQQLYHFGSWNKRLTRKRIEILCGHFVIIALQPGVWFVYGWIWFFFQAVSKLSLSKCGTNNGFNVTQSRCSQSQSISYLFEYPCSSRHPSHAVSLWRTKNDTIQNSPCVTLISNAYYGKLWLVCNWQQYLLRYLTSCYKMCYHRWNK